ncbi:calcium-binding protein, partial [Yersinia aleksiciae]|uniref:calcium-binding protein n=1 Tax=Yersinia aleksiciae TaxID=263819 RepID=UPI0011A2F9B2
SSRMLVIGSNDEDIISGSKQKDIIYGYGGSDDIDGGDGQDVIEAGDGDDFISGGDGNDHLYGEHGNDIIYGDKGADSVVGGFGADLIQGGDQKDYIEGNAGNDYISGDADNDYLFGGDGDDLIFGGDGDDLLEGDAEYYTQENEENNNSGNDHLFAGNGDDTLIAGKGNDFLDGGKGDDLYYFNIGDGTNIINEISEGNNTIHFDEHLISELTMTRHGSHFLFSSRKKGDNLRVLVKDQLSENGPKIQWLVTKKNPESTEPEFRIKIPNFVSEQSPDRGDIIDPDIADMLINEYIYGIKKISSTFNPKMKSNSTKDNLDMLVAAISLQDKWTLAGDMDYDFIPKNVVSYVTLLNAQYTHIHG